jgi:hypothetical protein
MILKFCFCCTGEEIPWNDEAKARKKVFLKSVVPRIVRPQISMFAWLVHSNNNNKIEKCKLE